MSGERRGLLGVRQEGGKGREWGASRGEDKKKWKGKYEWRGMKLTLLPQSVLGSAHSCTPGQMHLPVNRDQSELCHLATPVPYNYMYTHKA